MLPNIGKLSGLTVFITGASRGIGKAIGIKVAKDGANVVIAARTTKSEGNGTQETIYTAAKEIEEVGGECLPCVVDVSNEDQVRRAVSEAVKRFGGIDIVINNAYFIELNSTERTDMEIFDKMFQVNVRGTFLVTKICLPYLKESKHGHVLNICPTINLRPKWFEDQLAYSISKFGVSMCVLGMHKEFQEFGVAVNALWPLTTVYTPSIENSIKDIFPLCRNTDIMSDAAYWIHCQDPKKVTGRFYLDEEALRDAGVRGFSSYDCDPHRNENLILDFFVEPEEVLFADIKPKL